MMNDWLFNLYWAIARMGMGLGGVAYDLNLPRQCASRLEGTSET